MRRQRHALAVLVMLAAVAAAVPAAGQTAEVPRTGWGVPDLQGVWDFRSLTPMERPAELADREAFTEEEAASFSEEVLRDQSRDLTDADAEAATGRVVPYNDFWFDWGSTVTTERTSLIVDPPDGRMPALTQAVSSCCARPAQRPSRAWPGRDSPRGMTTSARRCAASWGSTRARR